MGKRGGPKWYAVRVGRSPGVYRTWDECEEQVTGFPGCRFKSFPTYQEALAFAGTSGAGQRVNKRRADFDSDDCDDFDCSNKRSCVDYPCYDARGQQNTRLQCFPSFPCPAGISFPGNVSNWSAPPAGYLNASQSQTFGTFPSNNGNAPGGWMVQRRSVAYVAPAADPSCTTDLTHRNVRACGYTETREYWWT